MTIPGYADYCAALRRSEDPSSVGGLSRASAGRALVHVGRADAAFEAELAMLPGARWDPLWRNWVLADPTPPVARELLGLASRHAVHVAPVTLDALRKLAQGNDL